MHVCTEGWEGGGLTIRDGPLTFSFSKWQWTGITTLACRLLLAQSVNKMCQEHLKLAMLQKRPCFISVHLIKKKIVDNRSRKVRNSFTAVLGFYGCVTTFILPNRKK